jgi:hypothetical protein
MVSDGSWRWPMEWDALFPALSNVSVPVLNNNQDIYLWKHDGVFSNFSTRLAWMSIRCSLPIVPWVKVVWFSQCIPKHSFFLWLVLRQKLGTQDRLRR